MGADTEHWVDYYAVTVERPAWQTVRLAIDKFRAESEAALAPAGPAPRAEVSDRSDPRPPTAHFAVDLGCGAGRDARELLRAGWRVMAVDRDPAARTALEAAVEGDLRARLQIHIEDLATVRIPPCELVNASLSLPFLAPDAFHTTWGRIVAALRPGARFAAMLFGDHDESASDPTMTCLPPDRVRANLAGFEIEHWSVEEDDRPTALGEPHHVHLIEFVARRTAQRTSRRSPPADEPAGADVRRSTRIRVLITVPCIAGRLTIRHAANAVAARRKSCTWTHGICGASSRVLHKPRSGCTMTLAARSGPQLITQAAQ